MSSDERSPKRQRRSFSPASPPHVKEQTNFVQPPQTPPPSVHMSPSWQSQPSQSQQQGSSGPGSVIFPSPPSTAGLASHNMSMEKSDEVAEGGQPTPAAEYENEQKSRRDSEGDSDARAAKRVKIEGAGGAEDAEHRRTDHERQEGEKKASTLSKSPHLFRLLTEPIAPTRPHVSQNLLQLYNLTGIQASVARRDEQGNKINKLRRSYEGKVKALGLEGKPKARVNDEGPALLGLLDPQWDASLPDGSTWWDAHKAELPLDDMARNVGLWERLEGAMSMKPGRLPKDENDKWVDRVGLIEDTAANRPAPEPLAPHTTAANPALAKTTPAQLLRTSAPASPRNLVGRPERAGKKRRYDESSYTGYQEGYEDDGYSTGGIDDTGRRRSVAKKQKRQESGPAAASPAVNNVGMVGARSS